MRLAPVEQDDGGRFSGEDFLDIEEATLDAIAPLPPLEEPKVGPTVVTGEGEEVRA